MKLLDIVLIIAIIILVYMFLKNSQHTTFKNIPSIDNAKIIRKKNKPVATISVQPMKEQFVIDSDNESNIDTLFNYGKPNKNYEINPFYTEAQFHNDYRDVLTAFNNISSQQKHNFNQANIPVVMSNPPVKEVIKLIDDFINEINRNIIKEVPNYRNPNTGWDELIPDKKIKSGWEKQMEKLNLPKNLYSDPASNSKITLIRIEHVDKFETEDEIKYVCHLIIQKNNVKDQLIIKVSLIVNKRNVNEDRNFFNDIQHSVSTTIDQITMLGFLSFDNGEKYSPAALNSRNFSSFDGMEKGGITDDKVILKELVDKYKQRTRETNNFNAILDTNGNNYNPLENSI